MKKSYNIKIYDSAGNFISSVQEKLRLSDISFKETINSGQGRLLIKIKSEFDSPPVWAALNNFVKVYVVKTENIAQNEALLFSGVISQVTNTLIGSDEFLTLDVLSLSSLLGIALYKDGANFDVVKVSDDPSVIATDIISKMNTQIGGGWFSTGVNVQSVGVNVSYTFKKKTWKSALKKTKQFSGSNFYWFIGANGELYFKEPSATADHSFNIEKNVNKIVVSNSSEEIINEATIKSASSSESATDTTSISNYFKRDSWTTDPQMNATAGQQTVDFRVETSKDPKLKTTAVINSTYDIESIHPGQTCKFYGTKIGSTTLGQNMLITGVAYDETTVTISLEDEFSDFGSQLNSYMENKLNEENID